MVSAVSIEQVSPDKLFIDRLPRATQRAFSFCIKFPLFKKTQWYLAGGTALALQVGHRQSVDLDFFISAKTFSETAVERTLFSTGQWNTTYRERGTIYGTLMEAKMSLIAYPFFIPSVHELRCGTVRLLDPSDIAAMKIIAISQRGRKRDFLDLYWYCLNKEPLREVIPRALRQYPGQQHNLPHILKSLIYFNDAEDDPMPNLYFKANWKTIKLFFQEEVKRLAKKLT